MTETESIVYSDSSNFENSDSFDVCGYPRDVLINESDSKFLCHLCHGILRQPCQNVCGHRFCRRGVDKRLSTVDSFPCPQCEQEGEEDEEAKNIRAVFPDNAIKRELSKQQAQCLNSGCSWRDAFKKYDAHEKECEYLLVICEKCGGDVCRGDLTEHLSSACPALKVETATCSLCRETLERVNKIEQILENTKGQLSFQGQSASASGTLETGVMPSQVDKILKNNAVMESAFGVLHKETRLLLKGHERLERQRNLDRNIIEGLRTKNAELERTVSLADINIKELEQKLAAMENTSYDGQYLWKLPNFSRMRQDAMEGRMSSIYSAPFYTHRMGYKMSLRFYPNGDGIGKGRYMSLFFVLNRGPCDALLQWPFRQKVTFKFLDQSKGQHHTDSFRPDPTSLSFKRPMSDMNIASGCPMFMPLTMLDDPQYAFIRDDTAFIHISVDTTGLDFP